MNSSLKRATGSLLALKDFTASTSVKKDPVTIMDKEHRNVIINRVFELVIGIVAFAVYKEYDFIPCDYRFDEELKQARCRIPDEIATIAIVAFPMFILPILLTAHIKYGSQFDANIINPLVSLAGFVVFGVAGGVEIYLLRGLLLEVPPYAALGGACCITGVAFLGDAVQWALNRRKNSRRGTNVVA